jgi:hypothetical protein
VKLLILAALVVCAGMLSGRPAHHPAVSSRTEARARAAHVPLPAGGNFNGIRWELAGGALPREVIDGVQQHNAACQWLRAWSRGVGGALRVLRAVPSWPAFRGTGVGASLAAVAAQAAAGGGPDASAMLAACDASHCREVAYARRLALVPST